MMAKALCVLAEPGAREWMRSNVGRSFEWNGFCRLEALASTGMTEESGLLSRERLDKATLDGYRRGWLGSDRRPRPLDFDEGGFLWMENWRAWALPVISCRSAASGPWESSLKWQPAALTVWQWDQDPYDDNPPLRLKAGDLPRMCAGFSPEALEMAMEGASGFFRLPAADAQAMAAMAERSRLDELCSASSSGGRDAKTQSL